MSSKSARDKILIGKNTEEFNTIAVNTIYQSLVESKSENKVLALSGGSTPRPIYEKLSTLLEKSELDPKKLFLIWIDERWVPPDAEGSNYKLVKDTFLNTNQIPEENIFPIPTMLEKPQDAIKLYEEKLN